MMVERIYNDSWHLIANLRVALVSHCQIFKQFHRGSKWYVLRETNSNKFFRISPEAYEFLLTLRRETSVGEHWESYVDIFPNKAPTQDEVVKLLSQLHLANLLYYDNPTETDYVFERHQKNKKAELRSKFASFLFVKIPLWNPDDWLNKTIGLTTFLFNRYALLVWLFLAVYAIKLFSENLDEAWKQSQGILSASNLVFLYISMFVLKLFHEFGHAMVTKKFGGNVSSMGVMLLLLTPIPFVDASSSWSFRNKYQRMAVGLAGMYVELFCAFIAVIIWTSTGEGVIHSLAFNVMFLASVSSVVFNGNPLLKFDAYYVLSDWLEIPNLYQRSRDLWGHWFEKYILKVKHPDDSPAGDLFESIWMAIYAVFSSIYRILVSISILLFVSAQWFLLGLIVATIFSYIWFFKPLYKFSKYLFYSGKLTHVRMRAFFIISACFVLLVTIIGAVPIPSYVVAPGLVQSKNFYNVLNSVEGYIEEVYVHDGDVVRKGQLLAAIDSKELDIDRRQTDSEVNELTAMLRGDLTTGSENVSYHMKRLATLNNKKITLARKVDETVIVAKEDGYFIDQSLKNREGTWVTERQNLGVVIDPTHYIFKALVSQEELARLFKFSLKNYEVRLNGAESDSIAAANINIIPFEQTKLPTAALGWNAGGDIAVKQDDPEGTNTKEAFFYIVTDLKFADSVENRSLHGRLGFLRIELPKETVATKVYRAVRQLMQQRFRI